MSEGHLLKAAMELAQAANKLADEHLPERIAGLVKLHAGLAVGCAIIPLPGADMAAGAANIWTMYIRINKELELPFSENIVKSLAMGALTNVGAVAAGMLVLGSAAKLIPGFGTATGIALVGATIYGVTVAAGFVYMTALTKLLRRKKADDITQADIDAAAAAEMRDKATLKNVMKQARKEYKEEHK
jgi:uncharacterized protein (DUF697 family)